MNRLPFSLRRAGLMARMTFAEAVRQRIFHLLLLLAAGLVLGARAFRAVNFGASELKFIADFGFGGLVLFGSTLTIVTTAQLVFSEIEHGTAGTLLAKPVWRAEFVLGKFLGVMALITVFCGVLTLVLAGVLCAREAALLRERPELFEPGSGVRVAGILAAGFAQWLKFGVLAAFTLLVVTFARTQLYAVQVSFVILVICHLQALAQQASAHAGSPLLRALAALIGLLFPNFQVFNLSEQVGGDLPGGAGLARIALYAFLYMGALGGLAVYSFEKREF